MSSLLRALFLSFVVLAASLVLAQTSFSADEEAEYAAFEKGLLEGSLTLEQDAVASGEGLSSSVEDLPPFINPTGSITVPLNTNFTILRNHSVAGGGTTAYWGLVISMGNHSCTDFRAQLGNGPSCNDSGLVFYGLQNVNIDPNYMTAQFLYTFVSSSTPAATQVSFCYQRPWEACSGNVTTIKVLMTDGVVDEENLFEEM